MQQDMLSVVWSYVMMVTNGNNENSYYFAKRVVEWFRMRKLKLESITDLRKMDRDCFSKNGNLTVPKKILLDIWNLLDEIGA